MDIDNPRLTNDQAAKWLGIGKATLRNWRVYLKGPDYIKVGGKVFYTMEALETWIEEQTVKTGHVKTGTAA